MIEAIKIKVNIPSIPGDIGQFVYLATEFFKFDFCHG